MLTKSDSDPEIAHCKCDATMNRYATLLNRADPPADAVEAVFAALPNGEGQRMLERALAYGIEAVPNAPQELKDLFALVDDVPQWVDLTRCNLGGAAFLRCRLGFLALACLSLPVIYSWTAANKALVRSGRLVHYAAARLKETARLVYAICRPDGLARSAEGFKLIIRVRLMHARVRRMLVQTGSWDAAWGVPINQIHMAGTALMFSIGALDGLERIGYRFTAEERRALLCLWRYAGYLMGIDPDLLREEETEARQVLEMIATVEPRPDADSRDLVRALMLAALDYIHRFPIVRRCGIDICYGISHALIGDELADALDYPRTAWRVLIPALRPAVRAIETLRLFSPTVQRMARASGPQAFQHLLGERGLVGRERCGS